MFPNIGICDISLCIFRYTCNRKCSSSWCQDRATEVHVRLQLLFLWRVSRPHHVAATKDPHPGRADHPQLCPKPQVGGGLGEVFQVHVPHIISCR